MPPLPIGATKAQSVHEKGIALFTSNGASQYRPRFGMLTPLNGPQAEA